MEAQAALPLRAPTPANDDVSAADAAAAKAPAPATAPVAAWYRDPGLIISAAAFVASLVTSGMAIRRDQSQDVIAKRNALHAIVQQHADNRTHKLEINKDWNIELSGLGFDFQKSEDNQGGGVASDPKIAQILDDLKNFNANFALETATLSKRAHSLVDELGPEVSAVDLSDVAALLSDAETPQFPEDLFRKAIARADSSVEYLGAARGLAKALFLEGRTRESQQAIDLSLNVAAKFPDEALNAENLHRTQFQTYVWAIGYLGTDGCPLARSYLVDAHTELTALAGHDSLVGRLLDAYTEAAISLRTCPQEPDRLPIAKP